MAELAIHGAIVFRGCGITDDQRFDRFVTAFGLENFPYDESLSNAVRRNRTPRIFTANEAPCDVEIFLHHEMAQTPLFPRYLFFAVNRRLRWAALPRYVGLTCCCKDCRPDYRGLLNGVGKKALATLSSCRALQTKPRVRVEVGETRWVLHRGSLPRRD